MADKPIRYPDWAIEDELSPAGAPNKVPVPDEFKISGLKAGEPMPRSYFNDQHNLIGKWIRYFEETLDSLAIDSGSLILQTIYDVGSYWITESSEDPSVKFGFGTWERVEGKFLVGRSTTDTDFDGVGEEGGSKTHSHSHSLATSSAGAHTHSLTIAENGTVLAEPEPVAAAGQTGSAGAHTHTITGSISTSSNLPPFRTVNIWRRVA